MIKLEINGVDCTDSFIQYCIEEDETLMYLKLKDILTKVTGSTDIFINDGKVKIILDEFMDFSLDALTRALDTINVTPSDFRIRGVEGTYLIFLTFKII